MCLQKYVAEDKRPEHSVTVSTTRSGIPRIIPFFHRKKVKDRNPAIIQLYMSFCSVSKLIQLAPAISKSTFESIVDLPQSDKIQGVIEKIYPSIESLLNRYIPGLERIPLKQGISFKPTWKSTPVLSWYRTRIRKIAQAKGQKIDLKSIGILQSFMYEISMYKQYQLYILARESKGDGAIYCSSAMLWKQFVRYPYDPMNEALSCGFKDLCADIVCQLPLITGVDPLIPPGRLCDSCSGDGKRRIFAIGNYVNQRVLAPLHEWLTVALRRLEMDGTFNQTAPLGRLKGHSGTVYSIDLKSATDRWPVIVLIMVVQKLFGTHFATATVVSALSMNIFDVMRAYGSY